MKKLKIKIILMSVIAVIIMSMPVYAAPIDMFNSGNSGYHEVNADFYYDEENSGKSLYHALKDSSLPSRYNSLEQDWYKKNESGAPLKDQNPTGLCWCFATTTACELSWLKETNGTGKETSPGHLGYFFYNRINDPLGLTFGDSNFFISNDKVKTWYGAGGNPVFTFQAMANRTGLCLEAKAPFSHYFSGYNTNIAYDNYIELENAFFIDIKDVEKIKSAVKDYGAVTLTYNATQSYDNLKIIDGRKTVNHYYDCEDAVSNHLVTIVGWDDNWSRENFKSAPEGDGAWIVQNSWGESFRYYYISYYDKSLTNDVLCFDMMEGDKYDNCYQYDGNAFYGNRELSVYQRAANIFTVADMERGDYQELNAVGFTTWEMTAADYTISVYTGVYPNRPESGTRVCSLHFATNGVGYYTVTLPESIKICEGEMFSVVIQSQNGNISLGVEKNNSVAESWIGFSAGLSSGQSFMYNLGRWSDMYSRDECFRIKAFTDNKICNHTGLTHTPNKAADCENDGNIEYWECTDCRKIFDDADCLHEISADSCVIKAKGHSIIHHEAKAATCTESGYYAYDLCENCSYSTYSAIPAFGHSWDEGRITTEPTGKKEGIKTYTCSRCNSTKTEAVPRLNNPFKDVKEKDYFFDAVLWAVNRGITSGTSKTTFGSDEDCTRGQIVTFLYRAAGEPGIGSVENPFVDVKNNDYFYKAVMWAVGKGITSGTDATHFSPKAPCTRAQAVTFMWRAQGEPEVKGSNPFRDIKSSAYYYTAVLWAKAENITSGVDKSRFAPDNTCTRPQIVSFLYRFMK